MFLWQLLSKFLWNGQCLSLWMDWMDWMFELIYYLMYNFGLVRAGWWSCCRRWKGISEEAISQRLSGQPNNIFDAFSCTFALHFISSSINIHTSNEIYIVQKMGVCSPKEMHWQPSSDLNLVVRNYPQTLVPSRAWTLPPTNGASVKTVFACHRKTRHVQAVGTALRVKECKSGWKGAEW